MTATLQQEIMYSALAAVLFAIFASPFMFKLVNSVLTKINIVVSDDNGLPTDIGLGVHALVFGIVVFLIMYFSAE